MANINALWLASPLQSSQCSFSDTRCSPDLQASRLLKYSSVWGHQYTVHNVWVFQQNVHKELFTKVQTQLSAIWYFFVLIQLTNYSGLDNQV